MNSDTTLARDFQRIADWGFDSVVVHHLDERYDRPVVDAAQRANLVAVWPRRTLKHFVTTGALPEGTLDEETLVHEVVLGVPRLHSPATIGIDAGTDVASSHRAASLCERVRTRGAACVTYGSVEGRFTTHSLSTVDTAAGGAGAAGSLLESWLADYHRGLLAGRTAGVVVDRYGRPPGDSAGLSQAGDSTEAARAGAIRELIARARLWGPRLYGLAVESVESATSLGLEVRIAALTGGTRAYVLVYNPSKDRYARGSVSLADTLHGRQVTRAVEVPTSEAVLAGRVFEGQRGRIDLSVTLRPGDAALFELF